MNYSIQYMKQFKELTLMLKPEAIFIGSISQDPMFILPIMIPKLYPTLYPSSLIT